MNRFFEYTVNHPFLASAAAILAVMALVIEIRLRQRGSHTIGTTDAVQLTNTGALVLDVRSDEDYEAGHIIDARHVPASEIAARADTFKRYKEKPVLVYCENGFVSNTAAKALRAAGFAKVATLGGGLNAWRRENLPLVKKEKGGKKEGKRS